MSTQVAGDEAVEEEGSSKFDLGHALQQLRSSRPGEMLRALRKLHIRWCDASANQMRDLLEAAGVGPDILANVQRVVNTCTVCRAWTRPYPRSVTTLNLATRFNEQLEVDLLFHKEYVILHILDNCTRFGATALLADRRVETILEALQNFWFKVFGPPCSIVSDKEAALQSPTAASFLERRNVALRLRAKGQRAQTVERCHEILRRQLNIMDQQMTSDGVRTGFASLLSECTFIKNCLFRMGNHTPYEAVFGRTRPLFSTLQHDTGEAITDRESDRVRHAAIKSITQASAEGLISH